MILPLMFLLSFVGYSYGLYRMAGVEICFIPAVVIAFETILVYFGGIAGVLEQSVWLTAAAGMILCIEFFYRLKKRHLSLYVPKVFWVCFLAVTLAFLHILFNEHLQHYDNFSHWAVVVKSMLSTNSFPTIENKLIEFHNYPLGSSTWIYYVCYFCGRAENTMLLAQGVLIFSLFAAIFGTIRRKKVFLLYGVLATGCSILTFFNITIRINNLLVDFLLPLFVLACWGIMEYYGNDRRQYILLTPLMAMLLIIKSTGVIFCAFAVFGWIYHRVMERKEYKFDKRTAGAAAVTLLLSSSTYLAWKYHMDTVFAGVSNKFETDASKIVDGGSKTADEIREIVNVFIKTALDLKTRPAEGLLIINIVVIGVIVYEYFFKKRRLFRLRNSLILLDLMTLSYYAGILAMYVFSMPMDEASTLAGFDRYASSIVVLFAGGIAIAATVELENLVHYEKNGKIRFFVPDDKYNYQRAVLTVISVTLIILTSEYNGMKYNMSSYDSSLPRIMKSVTGDRWYEGGKEDDTKYLFYGTDHDGRMTSYYFHYVARYYMYAPNIDAICSFYEDNLDNLLSGYEVLGIIEPDNVEKAMLKKHYGIDGESGFYRIDKKDDGKVTLIKMEGKP